MDSRLAIISAATFAGVVGAAALVSGLPGFVSDNDDSAANTTTALATSAPASDTNGYTLDVPATASEVSLPTDDSSVDDHESATPKSKDDSHHHDSDDHHDDHDDGDDD